MTQRTGWTDAELSRLRLEGIEQLNRLLSGEATEQDAAELVAWRLRSHAHEEAFRSAIRLRRLVQAVEAGHEAMGSDKVVALEAAAQRRMSRRAWISGALAASTVGGALFLGRSLDLVPSLAELRADYRTGTGERRLIRLADGASIELNTRSSIVVRPDLAMPAAELISGEAVVTSGRPGRAGLVAGPGTSVARDGRFTARRDGDDVCVTCLTGLTQVSWRERTVALQAHDQVRYDEHAIEPVTRGVDTAVLTAWQSGTLIFRNMPMRKVIEEINRYRGGKIFLASDDLAKRSLSGTYYVNRLDEFFSQAQLALGAKVTRIPGNVVILS